jgi:hypothetical protein
LGYTENNLVQYQFSWRVTIEAVAPVIIVAGCCEEEVMKMQSREEGANFSRLDSLS